MKQEMIKEQLKEVRKELKYISDDRRESLKDYRYWKRIENKLKEQLNLTKHTL